MNQTPNGYATPLGPKALYYRASYSYTPGSYKTNVPVPRRTDFSMTANYPSIPMVDCYHCADGGAPTKDGCRITCADCGNLIVGCNERV